ISRPISWLPPSGGSQSAFGRKSFRSQRDHRVDASSTLRGNIRSEGGGAEQNDARSGNRQRIAGGHTVEQGFQEISQPQGDDEAGGEARDDPAAALADREAQPTTPAPSASRTTSRRTCHVLAPRATRTPMSRVRRPTAYINEPPRPIAAVSSAMPANSAISAAKNLGDSYRSS